MLSINKYKSVLYDIPNDVFQQMLDDSNTYADFFIRLGLNPHGRNNDTLKKVIKEKGLNTVKLDENRKNNNKKYLFKKKEMEDILSNKVSYKSSWHLLKRLIKEGQKEYKCERCGISEWMGNEISLTLHHEDGNHKNNSLQNLKILCPNCHSQTDTFAGKNLDKKRKNVVVKNNLEKIIKKQEELKQLPIDRQSLKYKIRTQTFSSIGEEYGVSDNSIRKWCKKYNLPYKKMYIKSLTDEE